MDKNFELLRIEVNYLLFAFETCLGTDIKKQAEDALNYIFYCFFFNKQDIELPHNINMLQINISSVSDEHKEIYPIFKEDIPTILAMMELIRIECSII